jgi:hypothetical protein
VSFTFRCALICVDTYAHTLFLEVNFVFQLEILERFKPPRASLLIGGLASPLVGLAAATLGYGVTLVVELFPQLVIPP